MATAPNAYEYALSGEYTSVEPDYTQIDAYMVTVDRHTATTDFSDMKEAGVIGINIEAGFLFTSMHRKQDTYVSPMLAKQVAQATKAEIPFSLYATVRARNVEEAREEIKWLRIYIQKYIPPLGVWLQLELANNKTMNDMIIDTYLTMLKSAGLAGKVGFYVTRNQLASVSWSKWQSDFLLWLVDRVDDLEEIEQILTPEFFMLNPD